MKTTRFCVGLWCLLIGFGVGCVAQSESETNLEPSSTNGKADGAGDETRYLVTLVTYGAARGIPGALNETGNVSGTLQLESGEVKAFFWDRNVYMSRSGGRSVELSSSLRTLDGKRCYGEQITEDDRVLCQEKAYETSPATGSHIWTPLSSRRTTSSHFQSNTILYDIASHEGNLVGIGQSAGEMKVVTLDERGGHGLAATTGGGQHPQLTSASIAIDVFGKVWVGYNTPNGMAKLTTFELSTLKDQIDTKQTSIPYTGGTELGLGALRSIDLATADFDWAVPFVLGSGRGKYLAASNTVIPELLVTQDPFNSYTFFGGNPYGAAVGARAPIGEAINNLWEYYDAILWKVDGRTINLNEHIDHVVVGRFYRAVDMNTKGEILGEGSYNGERHAILLTPIDVWKEQVETLQAQKEEEEENRTTIRVEHGMPGVVAPLNYCGVVPNNDPLTNWLHKGKHRFRETGSTGRRRIRLEIYVREWKCRELLSL